MRRQHVHTRRGTPAVLLAPLLALLLLGLALGSKPGLLASSAQAAGHGPRTYYVSAHGADAGPGTRDQPWQSLQRASQASLAPGDRLLLRRGDRFTGTLAIRDSGAAGRQILVGAFGSGRRPVLNGGCLQVDGSWVTIRSIRTQSCTWAGITLSGDRVSVLNSVSTDNVAGIYIRPGADDASVRRNRIFDNRRMSVNTPGGNDDSGAFGVLVQGDGAQVAWNVISGQFAMSYDYGMDGSAVEVYGARGTRVDHNIARDNNTFSELGDPRTSDTSYAFNVVTGGQDDATFLITRGAKSSWGPILRTTLTHNSVLLTGTHSEGFVCHGGCSPDILTLRANLISAVAKCGYADGPLAGGGNLYSGGQRQFTLLAGDRVAAPMFVDASAGDLALRRGSPAVDQAGADGFRRDARGRRLPRDGDGDGIRRADIGALER